VFDFLFARGQQGTYILRVEDTDQTRQNPGSIERMYEALKWLGVEPDEGVYVDEAGQIQQKGDKGPYIQSERKEIYKEYAEKLLETGHGYRCFATPEELEAMRAEQQAKGLPPRYDRRFRDLSKEESDKRAAAGEAFVIRQAMPLEGEIKVTDMLRGEISFQCTDLDDHVLLKKDGFPTYQFANVVDDHLMEITHVLRGEEYVPSVPKNVLLYQAFGWEPPVWVHLPLILGPDRSKLSKRHGAETVLVYRDRGYLPEALFNALAFIGWSPGTEEEFFTVDELIRRFELSRVQKAAAVFDLQRLDYVNGWYIRKQTVGEVASAILPYLQRADIPVEPGNYLLAVAASVHERLKHYDEAPELTRFFFVRPTVDDALRELIVPKKSDYAATIDVLKKVTDYLEQTGEDAWTVDGLDERLRLFIHMGEHTNMAVLWPIRAALTGVAASPGAFEMLHILGKEESLARLRAITG
jgi:nondiscriminating glutamyl-tRNA synthetase